MPAAPNQIPAPTFDTPLFVNGSMNQAWYIFFQQAGSNILELQSAFTNFTTFTPAITSSMTLSGLTIQEARYQQYGNVVSLYVAATFTTGGTASNSVSLSLPLAPVASPDGGLLSASITDGTQVIGQALISGANLIVTRYDNANWGLGSGRGIVVSGSYRSA